MLRNNSKIALYLILISLSFQGCSNIKPVVNSSLDDVFYDSLDFIKINSDPEIKYKLMNNLSYELRNYVTYLRRYLIEIDISNEEGTATYNEKEVTKEQVLFKTFVRIYNKNRELVMNTYFDTYSSFFVRDDIPIASISSRCNTLDSIIQNISNTLSIRIISFIEDNKWD